MFRVLAWCAGVVSVICTGTLFLLNNADFQKFWVERILKQQGVDAHFEEFHFDFLISDKIFLRGGNIALPDGKRIRIEHFSARHNGTRGLFSGEPSFRDFSCEGFSLDDGRGRRLFGFSARAKSIEASFLPWEPIEKFTLGTPVSWVFSARELLISAVGKKIAEGSVRGEFFGAEPLSLSGRIRGDFAALLEQPVFSKINNVATGNFEVEGKGRAAELVLSDLRSRYGHIGISEIRLSATRGRGSTGTLDVEISGEEKSRASIRFSHLAFGDGRLIFSGETVAQTLVVSDAIDVGLLFRGWRNPPRMHLPDSAEYSLPPVSENHARVSFSEIPPDGNADLKKKNESAAHVVPVKKLSSEEFAFWHGVSGTMDFHADRVVFPKNRFGLHRGTFSVSDTCMEIKYTIPEFFDGKIAAQYALTFSSAEPQYRLSASLTGEALELYRLIPALRSRNPAPLEGRFNAELTASATANLPENLEKNLDFRFGLKSVHGGRVRIFNADSKKIRLAGDILRIGGNLAGMLGGLTRNIEPGAANLASSAEIVKNALTDFSYSVLNVRGNYRVGGDLILERLDLLGDLLNISGTAAVRPLADVSPEEWPIRFSAKTQVRGALAEALTEFGALRKDEMPGAGGFFNLREFAFSGTLRDSSEKFFENLIDAASGRDVHFSDEEHVPLKNLLDIFTR